MVYVAQAGVPEAVVQPPGIDSTLVRAFPTYIYKAPANPPDVETGTTDHHGSLPPSFALSAIHVLGIMSHNTCLIS
jgi:hypothetical protein